jgi:hypothetical protein
MKNMREMMLEGKLVFPGTKLFDLYPKEEKVINKFWKSVWYNYLNDVVRRLSHNGWIVSNALSGRKYADVLLCTDKLLDFVTIDEVEEIKAKYKYSKYILECSASNKSTEVRQNGKVRETGLIREGFMEAGNTVFGFDTETANKYRESITSNLVKSMRKVREIHKDMKTSLSSYDEVSERLLDHHIENPLMVYTTGDSFIDSRGRAVSSALSKVMNPIGSKDARSLLVITY